MSRKQTLQIVYTCLEEGSDTSPEAIVSLPQKCSTGFLTIGSSGMFRNPGHVVLMLSAACITSSGDSPVPPLSPRLPVGAEGQHWSLLSDS